MCGLIGAFRAKNGFFPANDIGRYLATGLLVSTLRGESGTGVGTVGFDYVPFMQKSAEPAWDFLESAKMGRIAKTLQNTRLIMGHTRSPTGTSAVSSKNAHPFYYIKDGTDDESILLTHNGHIHNALQLTPNTFNHQVDSAHAAYSILVNGGLDTLKKINGFYVLIWYDQKAKTMNIARNTARELYLARNVEENIIYYASEREILQFALDKAKLPYQGKGLGDEAFTELPPYTLFSWNLEDMDLKNPIETPYEEKKAASHSTGHTAGNTASGSNYSNNSSYYGAVEPAIGTMVWAGFDKDAPFTPYKDRQGNESKWGVMVGKRNMDNIKILLTGVNIDDWNNKWIRLRMAFPVKIAKIFIQKDDKTGKDVKIYEAKIDIQEAEKEILRLRDPHPTSSVTSLMAKAAETAKKKPSSDVAVVTLVAGPRGKLISDAIWREIAKQGCLICQGSILPLDVGKVEFVAWPTNKEDVADDSDYSMLCPICVQDADKRRQALGA